MAVDQRALTPAPSEDGRRKTLTNLSFDIDPSEPLDDTDDAAPGFRLIAPAIDAILSSLQGEAQPVAWLTVVKATGERRARLHRPHPSHDARLDVTPLFAHPSPEQAGEVERLRGEVAEAPDLSPAPPLARRLGILTNAELRAWRESTDRAWAERMASKEGDLEVGAGFERMPIGHMYVARLREEVRWIESDDLIVVVAGDVQESLAEIDRLMREIERLQTNRKETERP